MKCDTDPELYQGRCRHEKLQAIEIRRKKLVVRDEAQ